MCYLSLLHTKQENELQCILLKSGFIARSLTFSQHFYSALDSKNHAGWGSVNTNNNLRPRIYKGTDIQIQTSHPQFLPGG